MMQTHFPFNRRLGHSSRGTKSPQGGFSLVEIMVALVIGMIGVIVIMQVARTAEAQKRITTGAGSAQDSGALSIYSIQRDVKQAGYGLTSLSVLGCPLTLPAEPPLGARTLDFLAPVIINPADIPEGDDDTDTLLIVYGSSAGSPEGDTINGIYGQQIGVMSSTNFRVGERVVVAPMTPVDGCVLALGAISVVTADTVTVPGIGAVGGGLDEFNILFDLGPTPKIAGYAIRNGNLTTCDYMKNDCSDVDNWQSIANGIISLRAQYGRDAVAPLNGSIDTWDQETPALTGNQLQFASDWTRIAAVRLALLARNNEPAGAECASDSAKCPTQATPSWAGSDNNPFADPDSRYRYQVYEAVVPLRNIPWMGAL
jgi:type IV pilus assembly protein PilW